MSMTKKFSEILGAAAAATVPPSVDAAATALTKREEKPALARRVLTHRLLPGVAGAGAGAFFWKKHRWLGALAGLSVGDNAYRLWKGDGDDRKGAVADMGVTAAGIAASLYFKKHPVLGFLGGALVGSGIASFVPGSTAHQIRHG